jgi:hypothetical protein
MLLHYLGSSRLLGMLSIISVDNDLLIKSIDTSS